MLCFHCLVECRCADFHYAEFCNAECRNAECHYAERRVTHLSFSMIGARIDNPSSKAY
jgi:hypothetical protein